MRKILITFLLPIFAIAALPARAQTENEIQLRVFNLDPNLQSISLQPSQESTQLEEISLTLPAPSVSTYYSLPADLTGIGISTTTGSGFSGSFSSVDFVPGHSYIVVVAAVDGDSENVFIDETGAFGEAGTALYGDSARLLMIHALPTTPAAYSFADATGNRLFMQFLAADQSSFSVEFPTAALAIAAGDYSLNISASASGTPLLADLDLNLEPSQLALLVLAGDPAQAYLLYEDMRLYILE